MKYTHLKANMIVGASTMIKGFTCQVHLHGLGRTRGAAYTLPGNEFLLGKKPKKPSTDGNITNEGTVKFLNPAWIASLSMWRLFLNW